MVIIRNKSKAVESFDVSIVLLIASLLASLLVFITYYIIESELSLNRKETVWIVISSMVLVSSDILVLWVNIRINERNAETQRIKVQPRQGKADMNYRSLRMRRTKVLKY